MHALTHTLILNYRIMKYATSRETSDVFLQHALRDAIPHIISDEIDKQCREPHQWPQTRLLKKCCLYIYKWCFQQNIRCSNLVDLRKIAPRTFAKILLGNNCEHTFQETDRDEIDFLMHAAFLVSKLHLRESLHTFSAEPAVGAESDCETMSKSNVRRSFSTTVRQRKLCNVLYVILARWAVAMQHLDDIASRHPATVA